MIKRNLTNNKYFLIITTILLFGIYFSPYFINGQDSYILIHDNLDGLPFFNKEVFNAKKLTQINPNLPEIQEEFRQTNISFANIIFKKLGYFCGFIVNEILYRLIAFFAFFHLLKYIIRLKISDLMIVLLSFSFISLPFYGKFYLSISGLPLLIISFYNLYSNKKLLLSYLILSLFPFYAVIELTGIFALLIIGLMYLFVVLKNRKLYLHYLLGMFLLTTMYIVANYNLFYLQYFSGIVSNRAEVVLPTVDFIHALNKIKQIFVISQYHAPSLQNFIIIPVIFVTLGLKIFKKEKIKDNLLFIAILTYIVIASILYGVYYYEPIAKFYSSLGIGFNWARFYFISPVLWFILFGLSIAYLSQRFKSNKIINTVLYIIVISQIGYGVYKYTYKAINEKPSFKDFFSVEMFDDIKNKIAIDTEKDRIGCIGFFPSVANYNGFKTIGAYSSFYPLDFKHKFRKTIANELSQNEKIKKYYDNWGLRVYLYDNEIGKKFADQEWIKNNIQSIKCDLDLTELSKFGVKYLFSTTKIRNFKEKDLKLLYISDKKYYYRMYVYKHEISK